MDEILDRYAANIVDGILDDIADGESDSVKKTRRRLACLIDEVQRTHIPTDYRPKLTTKEGK
jgi:hypothetical protein